MKIADVSIKQPVFITMIIIALWSSAACPIPGWAWT